MARRRRDGRRDNENLVFIAFSPSVIFLRKTTAPSSEGACVCAEFSLFTLLSSLFSLLSSLFSARQYTHPITFDFGKRIQSVLPFGIFVSQNSVASLTVFLPYFSFIESIAFSIFSRLICFSMSKNISS